MTEWLILHTLSVAALAALAFGLCRVLRPRPAARHALWLLVLLKLLSPPLVHWPGAMPLPACVLKSEERGTTPGGTGDPPLSAAAAEGRTPLIVDEPAEDDSSEPGQGLARPARIDRSRASAVAWVIGGFAVLAIQCFRVWRFQRRIAGGEAAPEWLKAAVAESAAALRVRTPCVSVMEDIASPMVWGWGPARLLWPEGLERQLSPEGVRAVLVHELAHLRRRDHLVSWLLLAGACVWWWHPLYYLARRRLSCEAEGACDALVTNVLPAARRAYAEALLAVAARSSRSVAPALNAASGRRDLERRLTMIMRERVPCRLSAGWLVVLLAVALVSMPAWTRGQDTPKPTPASAKGNAEASVDLVEISDLIEQRNQPQDLREKRLQDLEARLRRILKELEDLRETPTVPSATMPQTVPTPTFTHRPVTFHGVDGTPVTRYQFVHARETDSPPAVVLSRTAYRLPAGKAEALATFLKENVKASVLETRLDGDVLVVTTTPETQKVIGGLVGLIRETARAPQRVPRPKPGSAQSPEDAPS